MPTRSHSPSTKSDFATHTTNNTPTQQHTTNNTQHNTTYANGHHSFTHDEDKDDEDEDGGGGGDDDDDGWTMWEAGRRPEVTAAAIEVKREGERRKAILKEATWEGPISGPGPREWEAM